ncbi:Rz-like lysis system protein LysB [Yersinia alsatica]|uniref:Rz-like lysis system protein LysB n=1 Tax=Yersinia alsatica TaxID=2890317 RepID=UPI0011A8DE19|nr:Rz-like lysis system protein LysB [Yersinia alsatica]
MKTLIVLLILAIIGLWWMNRENSDLLRDLNAAHQVIAMQKNDLNSTRGQLNALRDFAHRREQAQIVLRQQLANAQQLNQRRSRTIIRLLNENEMLRRWYQSVLPDDITRLHSRPGFDNPTHYLRWLSKNSELPDTTQSAKN